MGLAIRTFYTTAPKRGRELWKSPALTIKANIVSRGRGAGDPPEGHWHVGAHQTGGQEGSRAGREVGRAVAEPQRRPHKPPPAVSSPGGHGLLTTRQSDDSAEGRARPEGFLGLTFLTYRPGVEQRINLWDRMKERNEFNQIEKKKKTFFLLEKTRK